MNTGIIFFPNLVGSTPIAPFSPSQWRNDGAWLLRLGTGGPTGTPLDIDVIYTPLKSAFNGLQFRRDITGLSSFV